MELYWCLSELWHCLILLCVLEVFWFYATLIIFVDNNNNNIIFIRFAVWIRCSSVPAWWRCRRGLLCESRFMAEISCSTAADSAFTCRPRSRAFHQLAPGSAIDRLRRRPCRHQDRFEAQRRGGQQKWGLIKFQKKINRFEKNAARVARSFVCLSVSNLKLLTGSLWKFYQRWTYGQK